MPKHDIIIIGAGIVGLATALEIITAKPKTKLIIIDKEGKPALHQTGHNSGVIHSGLYYRPGSLKAKNCREGYHQLLKFCREEELSHEICGKVVVAVSEEELPRLEELFKRGQANGLTGIRKLNPEQIREVEPYCCGLQGLYVPQTGIVNFGRVAERMVEKLNHLGVEIVFNQRIKKITNTVSEVQLASVNSTWTSKIVISCAGLHSDRLARLTNSNLDLRIIPFRGDYYRLKKNAQYLVKNLIYPVPDPAFPFLGVHFTRLITGEVECGPNAVFSFAREAYKKTGFSFLDTWDSISWPGFRKIARKYWRAGLGEYHRSLSKKAFVKALQRLIPDIRTDHLEPGGAGIRAQACTRAGLLEDDFNICHNQRFIHVCNAPSPAATASLAIGKTIAGQAINKFT